MTGADRRAAYDAIRAVTGRDAYANLVLPALLDRRGLNRTDAAFATELCYGTLRCLGTLDRIIAAVAARPADPPVRDALRLGAYQLLYTRVPPHAAVSTTVSLIRAVAGRGAAGFGNAVLRRVAADDLDGWMGALAPADEVERLALRHAHPVWIVRALTDALGGADVAAALAADNEPAPVHLVARRMARDDLAAQAGGQPGRWSPYAVYLAGGAPARLPAVASGDAAVQDEGSQLVALAVTDVPLAGPDARWLDLCAGPGGKAALLGAVAPRRSAQVVAVEVAEHRAKLVAAATAGAPVRVVHADARQVGSHPDLPEASFDRVLLDAPCTGLGALRRRPEARWRRRPEDLAELTALQRELLHAARRAVRPGGIVAYVTCSPHLAETRDIVRDAPLRDARPYLPAGMPDLGGGPTVQLWPHRHGTDAMFLALLDG